MPRYIASTKGLSIVNFIVAVQTQNQTVIIIIITVINITCAASLHHV